MHHRVLETFVVVALAPGFVHQVERFVAEPREQIEALTSTIDGGRN